MLGQTELYLARNRRSMDWEKKEKENMSKKRKIKFMVHSGPDPRTSGLSGSYSNG
jgi:hypothetical protein